MTARTGPRFSVLSAAVCALALILGGAPAAVASPAAQTDAERAETAIDRAYQRLGGTDSGLGRATGAETCGLRDGGCYRNYEHGGIVWSPATGAQPSWGAIREAWATYSFENGPLGYPVAGPACSDGTCSQSFQRGTISWRPAEPATVDLDIDNPKNTAVVVNKERPLAPEDYAPEDLLSVDGQLLRAEPAEALMLLQQAAAADGVTVRAISGYRPFETQSALYSGYTSQYGQDQADAISARPGYSEHQTGLAVDIAAADGACSLQACFADTPAGAWAAENAHRFGFIVRYPAGASAVTGYAHEPWHLRFVGVDLAFAVHSSGVSTLEEYFHLPAAPGYPAR
ncbi:D-alanyl-D-alanine carboxypeptidase family protein [Arthrobacter sp. 08Y14]|uniref:D-alanyl-D-alanine carboxypeptidase family protein n=1 Tax=Arthrobacter sp. 08Y14 TaxID=2058885 RepID=UPI0015E32C85|nr:D-alanyl-D-alanine carboxypeptidase family protein [Arthrobacter sp. 08Y14]